MKSRMEIYLLPCYPLHGKTFFLLECENMAKHICIGGSYLNNNYGISHNLWEFLLSSLFIHWVGLHFINDLRRYLVPAATAADDDDVSLFYEN